ncbi:uncharacterized protein [Dermacentor albipictus]|uniref:uncharacterized protein n=1 Tax=Dermacentor albipictus TaxID=60249 RepID=UPI0031FCDEE6
MTVDEWVKRADPSSMPPATSTPAQITVCGFLLKKDVAKAEIVWFMNAVMAHASLRSVASSAAPFPLVLQSCEIVKKMQLGKDKVEYTICHDIAPFFQKKLLSALAEVSYIAVAFNESLNKVAQKEQMDVLVRYCDLADATVKTRYLTSCFLGHTCSEDLTLAFKKATEDIKHKILQVSMDGPNVNFKFLRSVKEALNGHDSRQILEIGSCGLHVVHGAFKTGHAATGWNLVVFLWMEVGKKLLAILLEILTQHRWLSGLETERAHRSYVQACWLSSAQLLLKNFDRTAQGTGGHLVRIVYDGVSAAGGVASVDITDSVVEMVHGASIRWKEELKKKKQDRLDASEAEQNWRRTATRIKELQQKKQRLITEAQSEASLLQQEIDAFK